jgi:hypothetical protein
MAPLGGVSKRHDDLIHKNGHGYDNQPLAHETVRPEPVEGPFLAVPLTGLLQAQPERGEYGRYFTLNLGRPFFSGLVQKTVGDGQHV